MVLRKKKNPNSIITNLTDTELAENEVSVLKFGLKHGLLTWKRRVKWLLLLRIFGTKFY